MMGCLFGHKWMSCAVHHEQYTRGPSETIVLMKCERCADQKVNHLDGTWTLEQVRDMRQMDETLRKIDR